MKSDTKWKDFLLKSGIPLEYEINNYLEKKGCISSFEFSYLRENENNNIAEFSYDIDASYIRPPHFIDLMVECKYRHESTKWFFLPDRYGGPDEVYYTDFMHPIDHFNNKRQFLFSSEFPYQLAPLCSKGIEITSEGQNPKSIFQAISQLSYGMARKIIDGMYHQVDDVLSKSYNGVIFYNIPIIVTTAQLFRIKENVTIDTIKTVNAIEEISTPEDILIVKHRTGMELQAYNYSIFQSFISKYDKVNLCQKLNPFNKDIDLVFSTIAEHSSPSCIVIIRDTPEHSGFEKFFAFINEVIEPSESIFEEIRSKRERLSKIFENHHKKKGNK